MTNTTSRSEAVPALLHLFQQAVTILSIPLRTVFHVHRRVLCVACPCPQASILAESLQVSALTSSVLVQNKLFVVCVQEPMEAVLCLSSCVMNTWKRCCCPTLEDLRGSAPPTSTHFSRGRLFLIFLLDVLRTCSHSLCLRSCTASHFCIIVRELRCSRVFNSCELAPIPTSQEERWCCQSHIMSANGPVKCMLFPTNIETVRSRVV